MGEEREGGKTKSTIGPTIKEKRRREREQKIDKLRKDVR
jgi:hypothetical protein